MHLTTLALGGCADAAGGSADAQMDGDDRSEQREAQPVPTVLQWSMGGTAVYVTGSFNHWGERIPLRRSGGDFVVCLNLLPGELTPSSLP